jgi:hypothetical protein
VWSQLHWFLTCSLISVPLSATVLASRIEAILNSFPLGSSGYALVFSSQGLLIASTLAISPQVRRATNVFSPNATDALAIPYQELIDRGYVTDNTSSLVLGNDIVPRVPFQTTVHSNGRTYNVRVSQLAVPGLDWFLLVYTYGSDYNGGLDSVLVDTSAITVAVVVVALLLTILVSRLLTRPLLRVSALLNDTVIAIGMERGRKQRRALKRVVKSFEKQTGQRVDGGKVAVVKAAALPAAHSTPMVEGEALPNGDDALLLGPVVRAPLPSEAGLDKPRVESNTKTLAVQASPATTVVGSSSASAHAIPGPIPSNVLPSPSLVSSPAAGHVPMILVTPATPLPAASGHLEPPVSKRLQLSACATATARVLHPVLPWWRRTFCCCVSRSKKVRYSRETGRGNLSAKLLEVSLMHQSIASLLHALSANDQLELVNQAKRAFIRSVSSHYAGSGKCVGFPFLMSSARAAFCTGMCFTKFAFRSMRLLSGPINSSITPSR